MENFGKQRCFDEEFVGWCRAKDQQPAVEGPPFQPQPPLFDELNGSDFITLPKQELVSAERSSFKGVLVERQHGYIPLTVVPAKAGTHNHRLWNMGPRLRGDDGGSI